MPGGTYDVKVFPGSEQELVIDKSEDGLISIKLKNQTISKKWSEEYNGVEYLIMPLNFKIKCTIIDEEDVESVYALEITNESIAFEMWVYVDNGAEFIDKLISTLDPFLPSIPRNIPRGSKNALTEYNINEGNAMVNFPRNNTVSEYNHQSYLKNTPNIRGLRANPFTRKALTPKNFKPYTAHLVNDIILGNNPLSAINVQEGGKKKTRKNKINQKRR